MIEQKKRVAGTEYTIAQFPATKANKYLVRLVKMFGPALGELMSIDKTNIRDAKEVAKMGAAIETLSVNVSEEEFDNLLKALLELTFVGGQPVLDSFETRFQGKLSEMYQLLVQVLLVNYEDFIGGLAAKAKAARAAGSVSTSLTT